MNVLNFGLITAALIWSILFDRRLILIYFLIIFLYHLGNEYFKRKHKNSVRRKIQISTWDEKGDPTGFVTLQIDAEKVDKFLADHNAKNPDT